MENETCEHCGARLRRYSHHLTPILVHALAKFYGAICKKNKNSVHLKDDMDGTEFELDRYERSNWTKLRFHGLVAKVREDNHQLRGHWLITSRGVQFLKGEITVPKVVKVYRNNVVARSEDEVSVKDVVSSMPYVESIDDLVFDTPTTEDIGETVFKIKKRHAFTCPKCAAKMKIRRDTKTLSDSSVKVLSILVCPECGYEKKYDL